MGLHQHGGGRPLALRFLLFFVVPGFASSCLSFDGGVSEERMAAFERSSSRAVTGTVSYLSAGDPTRPRLIYVHGSPGDATNWAAYLDDPIAARETLSIDRPGFGESEPEGVVVSLREQAAALEPLLVVRDGLRPILVGHSLGGPIIARAAVDYPDRVGGLVICAGSLDPSLEELRWYNHVASAIEFLLARPLANSNQEMKGLRPELEELAGLLERVTCPVAIVHGEQDDLVPFANVAFLRERLTNAASIEVVAMADEGHFLIWSEEGEAEVRAAIERLIGPRPGESTAAQNGSDPAHEHLDGHADEQHAHQTLQDG